MLEFSRLLSQENTEPFESVRWVKHHIVSKDKDGKVLYECPDAEFPEFWSLDACQIFAQKYLRQSRINSEREVSAKQTFSRIVKAIAEEGEKQKYFTKETA